MGIDCPRPRRRAGLQVVIRSWLYGMLIQYVVRLEAKDPERAKVFVEGIAKGLRVDSPWKL